ncbi:hypothetical protein CDAR_473801, partial [Caerostris darwini]
EQKDFALCFDILQGKIVIECKTTWRHYMKVVY